MSSPESDEDEWGCPPHLFVLCALCGYDVCDDCEVHSVDGEEQNQCPGLTDSLYSPPLPD